MSEEDSDEQVQLEVSLGTRRAMATLAATAAKTSPSSIRVAFTTF